MQNTIIKLNYKSFGQGTPVIILHGLFGMLDNWLTVAKDLSEHYQVFILDLRNHGKSPHTDQFSYALMAEDLLHFMDENWIYKAHIIGHSLGGKLAMAYAIDHEDRIDKMIVVDIAPKSYTGDHYEIFNALTRLDTDTISNRKEIHEILSRRIPDFGVRQFLMKNLKRRKEGGFQFKMNLKSLRENYPDILKGLNLTETISTKTLFVRGSLSPYISDNDWQDIEGWFPNSALRSIENAGHWVHADQKEKFVKEIKRFLGA